VQCGAFILIEAAGELVSIHDTENTAVDV